MIADLRLLQLASPNLPIGGFTYSQGLEWAVEQGWVSDVSQMQAWLESTLEQSMACFELPLLRQAYAACLAQDAEAFAEVAQQVIAGRETAELRTEERQRGAALIRLLPSLDVPIDPQWQTACASNQISGFALAGAHWQIEADALCQGYLWAWLEGACVAGVKLIPLGQTQGQQLMFRMADALTQAVEDSKHVQDIGASTFAMALASAAHETQYTRLYRS